MFKILDFKRRHKKKGYRNGCPPTIYLLWYLASAHFTSKSFTSFHWLEKLPQNLFGKLEPKKRCVKKLHLTNRLLTMVSFGLLHLQRRSESRLFGKKVSLRVNWHLSYCSLSRVCNKHCPLFPGCLYEKVRTANAAFLLA